MNIKIELNDLIVYFQKEQIIDEPNQLSKDTQAQLILFKGQCEMNAMLACNMQRKVCNESMAYIDCDFIDLQEEIECRINMI